jgi:hypothetical protein
MMEYGLMEREGRPASPEVVLEGTPADKEDNAPPHVQRGKSSSICFRIPLLQVDMARKASTAIHVWRSWF